MKKKYIANKDVIRGLREKANLNQNYFKEKGEAEGISYRQYQRAEAGEEVSKNLLDSIARFYDQFLKNKKGSKENITFENLVKKTDIKNKDTEKKNQDNEKTNMGFKQESSYLYRVEKHNQLERVIKLSSFRRKIFYKFDPSPIDAGLIKNFLTDITNLKTQKKITKDTDYYHELEHEISSLNRVTGIASSLIELKKREINVFAGNFNLPIITIEPDDPEKIYFDEQFGDDAGDWHSCVSNINYAIFCFDKNNVSPSITFTYHNNFYKEKLEQLNKKFDFKINSVFGIAIQECEDNLRKFFPNYTDRLDKEKTNLVETDVYDLLSDDEIQEIGEQYMQNEMEDAYYSGIDPKDD